MTALNLDAEIETLDVSLDVEVSVGSVSIIESEVVGVTLPAITAEVAVVDVVVNIIGGSSEPDVDFLLIYQTAKL